MSTSFSYQVRICEENRDQIIADIRKVENGRNHMTVRWDDIIGTVDELNGHLHVSPETLMGSCVDVDCHANDYHANRKKPWDSTQLTLQYEKDGWYIVNIRRATVRATKEKYRFGLTEKAEKEQIASFIDRYYPKDVSEKE